MGSARPRPTRPPWGLAELAAALVSEAANRPVRSVSRGLVPAGVGPPACTHRRRQTWGGQSLGLLRCSMDPPQLRERGGDFLHRQRASRTSPGHGIFGKRLPASPLPGPPVVVSRGGSCRGCRSHISLPTLGWGNAVPGENPAGESTPDHYRQGKETGREMPCQGRRVGREPAPAPSSATDSRQPWERLLTR